MIPFAPPRIDQVIIDAVTATLQSGWITTGPRTKLFETKLTEFCGNKATLCLNSATAGLEIMLRWFGVGEGDEVIIPAYTYAATANVVVHCGAMPVLVDIGSDFNIDCNKIKDAITSRTKVIMPVDFGGYPCDYDVIMDLVASAEIKSRFLPSHINQEKLGRIMVLSDAAHSFGATYKGKRTGQLADVSVFSFHAVKNLTTAEGGAVALNLPLPFDNVEIYNYLCVYTLHGQNKDALAKMQKGNWKYDVVEAGYKCNMTDIAAAIGLVELDRYEKDMLVKRKHICDAYNAYFSKLNWAELPPSGDSQTATSCHLYPLRIKGITEHMRDTVIQKIFDKDVSVNVHFIPLPMLTFYKNKGMKMTDYPVSFNIYSREISLPVYYGLSDDQIAIVCDAVSKSVDEVLAVKST
ncbi:MAG: DegT/DnrJ/EryC1/StrS aminotransferase family protein [Bacteroidota bacterium]|nr:DegT/DnrJ/EryC1/StrS aminotransferase family protein [Bacteroidota bacterium]